MLVFISWSGERSKAVAEALKDWLPKLIQSVNTWMSPDIEKGARWNSELSNKLSDTKFGIICLNSENLNSPWILFEAGALSKSLDANVCTLLDGVSYSEVEQPLAQFQNTVIDKDDIEKLTNTIRHKCIENGGNTLSEPAFKDLFNTLWPELEKELKKIHSSSSETKKLRSQRDLIEELIENTRYINNILSKNLHSGTQVIRRAMLLLASPSDKTISHKDKLGVFFEGRNPAIMLMDVNGNKTIVATYDSITNEDYLTFEQNIKLEFSKYIKLPDGSSAFDFLQKMGVNKIDYPEYH